MRVDIVGSSGRTFYSIDPVSATSICPRKGEEVYIGGFNQNCYKTVTKVYHDPEVEIVTVVVED